MILLLIQSHHIQLHTYRYVQQYVADPTATVSLCGAIETWDIAGSSVTALTSTFQDLQNFNADISAWNVANIESMYETFMNSESFNANIQGWNVARVTNMESMFSNAGSFDRDISGWDVSRVTNMNAMLNNAQSFDVDITSWDIGAVTQMDSMLGGLSSYTDCMKETLFNAWNASYPVFRSTYGSAQSSDSSFYAASEDCNATTESSNPQSSDDDGTLIAIGVVLVLVFIAVSTCIGMLAIRRLYAEPSTASSSIESGADYY